MTDHPRNARTLQALADDSGSPVAGGLLELDLVLAFYGNYGDPVLNVPQRAAYRS